MESIGLKVLYITADGASHNRTFFRMHKIGSDGLKSTTSDKLTPDGKCCYDITYRTKNRYAPDSD